MVIFKRKLPSFSGSFHISRFSQPVPNNSVTSVFRSSATRIAWDIQRWPWQRPRPADQRPFLALTEFFVGKLWRKIGSFCWAIFFGPNDFQWKNQLRCPLTINLVKNKVFFSSKFGGVNPWKMQHGKWQDQTCNPSTSPTSAGVHCRNHRFQGTGHALGERSRT